MLSKTKQVRLFAALKTKEELESKLKVVLTQIKHLSELCDHSTAKADEHDGEQCMHCPVCSACDNGYGYYNRAYSYVVVD